MFSKFFAIAANAFTETIRQPIFFVLVFVGFLWLAFAPSLAAFSLESGKDQKIMIDVGLASLLLYGLLAAAFSASSVITREIQSFTVLTVVSKPVSRPTFLLGKYVGISAALLVGYYFLCIVFLMTLRHGVMETATDKYDQPVLLFGGLAILISLLAAAFGNYVYNWHFTTTVTGWIVPLATVALLLVLFISPEWKPQHPGTDFGDMQAVYGVALVFCGILILNAFAVALSTRFNQVMTLLICAAVYLVGLLSDFYFGQHAPDSNLYAVLYTLIPNFQFFWIGDAITQDRIVEAGHVAWVAGYSACYTLAVLGVGVAMFQTREVG
jgi:hypothetical protein